MYSSSTIIPSHLDQGRVCATLAKVPISVGSSIATKQLGAFMTFFSCLERVDPTTTLQGVHLGINYLYRARIPSQRRTIGEIWTEDCAFVAFTFVIKL